MNITNPLQAMVTLPLEQFESLRKAAEDFKLLRTQIDASIMSIEESTDTEIKMHINVEALKTFLPPKIWRSEKVELVLEVKEDQVIKMHYGEGEIK